MRRALITLVCAVCIPVFCGCGKREGELVIAVIPKGTMHVFWKSVHAGAVKASEECGIEIIWKGPFREDSRDDQIKVVENMINRGVAGIVLAPLDETALCTPVTTATRKGIPVIIIDSGLKGEDHISFVATDNYEGGGKAGKHLAALLGGKGKVVLLRYQVGSASTTNREKGFLDAMKEYPGIEVVSANQYAGATRESAYKKSENLLAPLKTADGSVSVDGIFCPNESSTYGMLRALQGSGLAGKVNFVGFDSSEELVRAMGKGEIQGLILQDPINMGYLGVKKMVDHLNGKGIETSIDTGSTVVSPENMNEPQIKKLLTPDLKKWLKE